MELIFGLHFALIDTTFSATQPGRWDRTYWPVGGQRCRSHQTRHLSTGVDRVSSPSHHCSFRLLMMGYLSPMAENGSHSGVSAHRNSSYCSLKLDPFLIHQNLAQKNYKLNSLYTQFNWFYKSCIIKINSKLSAVNPVFQAHGLCRKSFVNAMDYVLNQNISYFDLRHGLVLALIDQT